MHLVRKVEMIKRDGKRVTIMHMTDGTRFEDTHECSDAYPFAFGAATSALDTMYRYVQELERRLAAKEEE